jgi:protease PrsW
VTLVDVMSASAALLPVILFLVALFLMDSFKLVPLRGIVTSLGAGGLAAFAVVWVHRPVPLLETLTPEVVNRYLAPVLEEAAKGLLLGLLISSGRIGFLVDAAVHGFAIGAGFALVENVLYLRAMSDAPLSLWLVRGMGTAMMHGATAAIFAMIARGRIDRRQTWRVLAFLPGFGAAVVIHSASNHLFVQPVAQTLIILIVLPAIMLWVFDRSERATREWMGAGMDLDIEVLQLVASEHFTLTRFGQYLQELRSRFPGVVVADMYCLLRLELELSVHARALIMAREAGLELAGDEDLDASLDEREYLQRSIGKVGLLALRPLQVTSGRDRWHRQLLAQSRKRR